MGTTIVGLMVCAAVYMVRFIHKEILAAKEEVELKDWEAFQEWKEKMERRERGE